MDLIQRSKTAKRDAAAKAKEDKKEPKTIKLDGNVKDEPTQGKTGENNQ